MTAEMERFGLIDGGEFEIDWPVFPDRVFPVN
jgi:hypothetical protein